MIRAILCSHATHHMRYVTFNLRISIPQFVNPMIVLWGIKAFCVSCFKAKVTDVLMDGVESRDMRHFDRWMEQQKKTPKKVSQLNQPIGLMPV